MDRKKFIKQGCIACFSMATLGSLVAACGPARFTTGKLIKDGLLLDIAAFTVVKNGVTGYIPYVIVRNEALQYPVCVYRFSETEYSALWMQCTHQGAELQVSGDQLHCPAHGSEFNNKGIVKNGPAGKDLKTFPVSLNKNELFIDLRKS